jgi:1,4-dihydroxy-2-naphthoate polyprenyltransferase
MAWLHALRLHFYPATVALYALGSLAAAGPAAIDTVVFASGLIAILALEAATVFTNEIYDFPSDVRNQHWGPLNGGSRVLVRGRLTALQLRRATVAALAVAAAAAVLLIVAAGRLAPLAPLLALAVLALGYTVPPLKLSHRTLGEIDVAVTHSAGLLVCGYVFQGGGVLDAFPWLLSIPLGLSMLPSITLAGIPDQAADAAAGKWAIAARLGRRAAAWCAIVATVAAAVAAVLAARWAATAPAAYALPYFAIPHAVLLTALIVRYLLAGAPHRRVDALIVAALAYGMWFGMVPLVTLAVS